MRPAAVVVVSSAAVERNAPPQRVAVKEGDSQLYGINAYASESGITSSYTGPFAIDSKGSHVKKSTVSIAALSGCYFKGNIVSMSYDDKSSKITYAVYNADTCIIGKTKRAFLQNEKYIFRDFSAVGKGYLTAI